MARSVTLCVAFAMPEASNSPDNLPLNLPEISPGTVNPSCRFYDQGGRRFILINGSPCYNYEIGDRVSASFIWITIRENNQASLPEIAAATGLSLRTLQDWRKKFKANNYEGLLHEHRSGRPRTITDEIKNEAITLIKSGRTQFWVAPHLGISVRSLNGIVADYKAKHGPIRSQQALPLDSNDSNDSDSPADAPPESEVAIISPTDKETEKSINHPGPSPDPRDRSFDRAMAKAGLLIDADPQFATSERVDGLGFFMALALLSKTDTLATFDKIYGEALGPAFYGLRTTVITMLMMLLLRIKRPDHLRRHNPENLGEVLGLDRIMEVKTLRKKLSQLAGKNQGATLMSELGKSRVLRNPTGEGKIKALYLDGHVKSYHGKFKLGQTWSATKNRVVKAKTNTWLHLPGQTAVYYLESPFNGGLISAINHHLGEIEEVCGGERPVLVFDREGWNTSFLKAIGDAGWKFITYRKGYYQSFPVETFEATETQIGERHYKHAPIDLENEPYNLYETETKEDGSTPKRKLMGEIHFREIRVLSDDREHQTAIVTNLSAAEADTEAVAATLFARWGNQENVFKYMIAEYGLDDLFEYNRDPSRREDDRSGEEEIPANIEHPNPIYLRLTRKISKALGKRNKILAKYGLEIEAEVGCAEESDGGIKPEKLLELVEGIRSRKEGENLCRLNQEVIELRAERGRQPERVKVAPAGYKQLRSGVSHIVDSLKMVAFDLDNQLYAMLEGHYPNRQKDGRQLIASALRTAGSLRVESDRLVVQLEAQSSAHRTAAVDRICEELNHLESLYPGTDLRIVFETIRD